MGKRTRRGWGSIVRKSGKLYARFTHPLTGRETMRRLQSSTKADAETEMISLRDSVQREVDGTGTDTRPVTLHEWVRDDYRQVLASQVAASTLRSMLVHFDRFGDWTEAHGDLTMDEVTRVHTEGFVADSLDAEYAPSYVGRVVRSLRRAWNDAHTRLIVTENPWVKLKVRAPDETEVPWVEPEDLSKILSNVTEFQRPLLTLIADTGLRSSEAQGVLWGDISLEAGEESVFVSSGKTNAARRRIPLTDRAIGVLRAIRPKRPRLDDRVFGERSSYGLLRALGAACEKAGHDRLTVHMLRHCYASHLMRAPTPVPTIARLLGHADGGVLVLRLYGRWAPQDAEWMAVDRLQAWRRERAQRAT